MATLVEPPEAALVRRAPTPPHGGPRALLRFLRRNGMLNAEVRAAGAALGWLKLRFRGRLQTDGLCFIGPGVTIQIGARRGAAARPLVVDRARHEDPRARGRGLDRREVRAGAGVHDLRLPARLDRARVHRGRPRDADRLRPRRGRGRAPDPHAGHLQARRARGPQLLDRLRRVHPARRVRRGQLRDRAPTPS